MYFLWNGNSFTGISYGDKNLMCKEYFIYNGENLDIYSYMKVSGIVDSEVYFESLKFKKVSYREYINYRLKHKVSEYINIWSWLRNWWSL